jgi:hypothetical protein
MPNYGGICGTIYSVLEKDVIKLPLDENMCNNAKFRQTLRILSEKAVRRGGIQENTLF